MLAVLPFGNVVATVTINGAELKAFLENGVSQMPGANGRFPQVSGLCFTYDIAAAADSRVTSAVVARRGRHLLGDRGRADGRFVLQDRRSTTSWRPVATCYPTVNAKPGYATQDIMDQVLADYVTAKSPLNPFVLGPTNGRINCADSNGATAPNCPALTPSP